MRTTANEEQVIRIAIRTLSDEWAGVIATSTYPLQLEHGLLRLLLKVSRTPCVPDMANHFER